MIRRPPRSTPFPTRRSSDLREDRGEAARRRVIRTAHDPRRERVDGGLLEQQSDRKSTRLNSSHLVISYAVFCLKKKIEKFNINKSCAQPSIVPPCTSPRSSP